ncbi:hypothetical protein MCG98_04760 [Ruminococcus sp. OA3]|uniref:hypothetical protein n=1 Tax=Ruminococcus sp. OA3 TaxID=2914164 RepID=UPI001F0694F7|nr:hypothetical protein [Ruminococcus sp. OA3]MCH1981882.1 hypothetical protein [Ruminococcus sp. OA3]
MRTVVISVTAVILLLLTGVAVLGIGSQTVRANELERNTDTALEQTMYNLKVNQTYGYGNGEGAQSLSEELCADFVQNFLLMTDSDSDVTVNILNADPVRGLLDVETKTKYRSISGNSKEINCRRTVLFDEWKNINKTYHKVDFVVDEKVVRSVNVHSGDLLGSVLAVTAIPEKEGMIFVQWKPNIEIDGELEDCPVTQNLTLTAVFI